LINPEKPLNNADRIHILRELTEEGSRIIGDYKIFIRDGKLLSRIRNYEANLQKHFTPETINPEKEN